MSWIKKELAYLKDSLPQVFKGCLIVILATSGLGIAILLRFLDFNGSIIAFVGILIEAIAMIFCYFLVRKYFIEKEESKPEKPQKKEL
jgi:multisubunit Na+/H+ antiporter MnhB subunit